MIQPLSSNSNKIVDFIKNNPTAELTGSRFFNTATVNSDWDFFMDTDPIGDFIEIFNSNYQDTLTKRVYQSSDELIHVQIVTDMNKKRKIQNFLGNLPLLFRNMMTICSKRQRITIWDWAIKVIEEEEKKTDESLAGGGDEGGAFGGSQEFFDLDGDIIK